MKATEQYFAMMLFTMAVQGGSTFLSGLKKSCMVAIQMKAVE